MKRLAEASQLKIYPAIPLPYEIPLRKILLTTRLWNLIRQQQLEEDWSCLGEKRSREENFEQETKRLKRDKEIHHLSPSCFII